MFEINLMYSGQAAGELQSAGKQLNMCLDEVSRSVNTLNRLSYMESPLKRLAGIQLQIEEEAAKALQLEKTLETVNQLYTKTEQMILDECEQTIAHCRREKTGYYNLQWLSEILSDRIL